MPRRPALVPEEYWGEMRRYHKADYMDFAWDASMETAESNNVQPVTTIGEFRRRMDLIQKMRRTALKERQK